MNKSILQPIYKSKVRKIFSFIMLCLLAFNWFGYRLMMDYLQQHNDQKLEVRFDNNAYDETQLIELKVPLHMAYQNSQPTYERCDGEINFKGTYYKYVKRKVANDTLYLKCVKNTAKANMELAKNDFHKNTNDLNTHTGKQEPGKSATSKKCFSDFDNYLFSYTSSSNVTEAKTSFASHLKVFYTNPYFNFKGQPPC